MAEPCLSMPSIGGHMLKPNAVSKEAICLIQIYDVNEKGLASVVTRSMLMENVSRRFAEHLDLHSVAAV